MQCQTLDTNLILDTLIEKLGRKRQFLSMYASLRLILIMLAICVPLARSYTKVGAISRLVRSFPTRKFCTTDAAAIAPVTKAPAAAVKVSPDPIELLEIRVGKIVEIGKHPEADSLFVEKVDLGEATGPRTIVSGLVEYCTAEQLLSSDVVVLCNLKPRALKGITSHGMLLCASNKAESKVQPLIPPAGVPPGELVSFTGHNIQPAEAGNRATKAFTKICDEFHVNENMQATYKGIVFTTSKGPITASIKGPIS